MKKILVVGLVIMCMLILLTPTIVADEPNCPEGYREADSDGDGICDVCYPIDDDTPEEVCDGHHDAE